MFATDKCNATISPWDGKFPDSSTVFRLSTVLMLIIHFVYFPEKYRGEVEMSKNQF
jgi:hypothetical protein